MQVTSKLQATQAYRFLAVFANFWEQNKILNYLNLYF